MTKEIPDRVKTMERLYREGLTQAQIASQFGLSQVYVGRLLKRWCDVSDIGRANWAANSRAATKQRNKNLAAKRQSTGLDKALEMHQAGMTYQEIADFIGVTRCAVAGYVFRQKRGQDQ
jgi:predicted transcriptional regulator